LDVSESETPALPPDHETWFWTKRFAKFALFGGLSVGAVIGALVVLFRPILAWAAQKGQGVIVVEELIRDAMFSSMNGALWTVLLLLPVTIPLGILLDWIEVRRMRDAEQAVKDVRNSRFTERKP